MLQTMQETVQLTYFGNRGGNPYMQRFLCLHRMIPFINQEKAVSKISQAVKVITWETKRNTVRKMGKRGVVGNGTTELTF